MTSLFDLLEIDKYLASLDGLIDEDPPLGDDEPTRPFVRRADGKLCSHWGLPGCYIDHPCPYCED